jgi:hypothetical protein
MFVGAPAGRGGSHHHYNFAQKIFQIGQDSTLGIAIWGLGNLPETSFRTLIASFADRLVGQAINSMVDIATQWSQYFWSAYERQFRDLLSRARELHAIPNRTPEQNEELGGFGWMSGGFCLGGNLLTNRTPAAFEILYSPIMATAPSPRALDPGMTNFWGCPNLIERLIYGCDVNTFQAILGSGKWTGSEDELAQLLLQNRLAQPFDLPIREAIDWVFTSIYTTNQAMKFSHLAPVCGGPIEIAVVTTDRPFRWVRHKRLDSAIGRHEVDDGD